MDINSQNIEQIVKQVLSSMQGGAAAPSAKVQLPPQRAAFPKQPV